MSQYRSEIFYTYEEVKTPLFITLAVGACSQFLGIQICTGSVEFTCGSSGVIIHLYHNCVAINTKLRLFVVEQKGIS